MLSNTYITDDQASGDGGKEKLPKNNMKEKIGEEPDSEGNPSSFGWHQIVLYGQ